MANHDCVQVLLRKLEEQKLYYEGKLRAFEDKVQQQDKHIAQLKDTGAQIPKFETKLSSSKTESSNTQGTLAAGLVARLQKVVESAPLDQPPLRK